jgi:hypothetical protein
VSLPAMPAALPKEGLPKTLNWARPPVMLRFSEAHIVRHVFGPSEAGVVPNLIFTGTFSALEGS